MSKVSEAIKAKRKQHRKDHHTDFDRKIMKENKGNQKGRRAARMEGHASQGNKSASDFDFNKSGKGHIGGSEIRHLQNQGHSKKDIMAAAKANGGEIGKHAQKKFDRWTTAKEKAQAAKDNPAPTATTQPAQANNNTGTGAGMNNGSNNEVTGHGNAVGNNRVAAGGNDVKGQGNATGIGNMTNQQKVDNTMEFNQSQDNDQEIVNNGNNNYNYQRADNSNRIYGGKTTVFNYQSSGNPDHDSPMSAAVMAGVHAVDDSPAARAARLDQNITMANDYAKDNMDTDWIAQGAIHKSRNNLAVNANALDERIAGRAANNFAQSKINEVKLFGDLDNQTADWKQPDPAKPVEDPDFKDLFNTYTDH